MVAVAAWTRLVRIHQRIDSLSEKHFRDAGLNTAWFDILARIGAREGLSQGELAETLLVTKGNVSQLIVKMEAEGLVERRAEGRFQHLYLTTRGRAIHNEVVPRQETLLAASLEALSPGEQRELVRLLRKWEKR
jgi:DNA-binding MarR family transcriptional regulator